MTENANLRLNLQNTPSIFEISASETLDNLIHPALNRIFKHFDLYICGKVPLREEVSSFLTWVLQYLYLCKRGASFGESFYGLQRTQFTSGVVLTARQQFVSATLLALVPYVEGKLKDRSSNHETSSIFESVLLRMIYAYNAIKSINLLLYLFKYSPVHAPAFRILGVVLRYPNVDLDQQKSDVFLKLLETFAFFLQFTQWWYNDSKRRKFASTLPHPKAFENKKQMLHNEDAIDNGKCPICFMDLETPTACSVSGYVYCFKCIMIHLKKEKTCPVTGYFATINDLIRIYESK